MDKKTLVLLTFFLISELRSALAPSFGVHFSNLYGKENGVPLDLVFEKYGLKALCDAYLKRCLLSGTRSSVGGESLVMIKGVLECLRRGSYINLLTIFY